MPKLFDILIGSPAQRQQRKRITVIAILVTAALIVSSLAAFCIAALFEETEEPKRDYKEDLDQTLLYTITSSVRTGDLILVNKNHPISFAENSSLSFMSTGNGYGLRDNSLEANPKAIEALNSMVADLNTNVEAANLVVLTAYRSKERQDSLNNGTPGGCSDYHTGLSFELKEKTNDDNYIELDRLDKYDWLYKNAHKYGFIVRYPENCKSETGISDYAYVFRYVGVPHATYIYENGLCLESYLDLLRTSHKSAAPLEITSTDSVSYKVFYSEKVEIEIDADAVFEISGDNMNGYIITVCESMK